MFFRQISSPDLQSTTGGSARIIWGRLTMLISGNSQRRLTLALNARGTLNRIESRARTSDRDASLLWRVADPQARQNLNEY